MRERAHRMLAIGLDDELPISAIDLDRLDGAVDLVLETTRKAYPTSTCRSIRAGGTSSSTATTAGRASPTQHRWPDRAARARAEFDLAIVSVLLDAGAGPTWRYRDAADRRGDRPLGRAWRWRASRCSRPALSRPMPRDPLRADADVLANLAVADLARGFQVARRQSAGRPRGPRRSAAPPRQAGRREAGCLRHATTAAARRPVRSARGAGRRAAASRARRSCRELLQQLGPIWPSRLTLGGIPLGDCWRHPALTTRRRDQRPGAAAQALAMAGLFADRAAADAPASTSPTSTASPASPNIAMAACSSIPACWRSATPTMPQREHDVASPLVVEWRALTVALLDRSPTAVRQRLGLDARVAAAGEDAAKAAPGPRAARIARERRADGSPPLKVISDGTVF